MDIRPPKNYRRPVTPVPERPVSPVVPDEVSSTEMPVVPETQAFPPAYEVPLDDLNDRSGIEQSAPRKKHRLLMVLACVLGVFILLGVSTVLWFNWTLQPRSDEATVQNVTIESGMTPSEIGALLEQKQLIRSALTFEWYTRLNGVHNSLKVGYYNFSPDQSVSAMVSALVEGADQTRNVIILPALTLKQLADPAIKNSLAAQGFSADEIERAYTAQYETPLLANRPSGASLEGYLFPETYQMRAGDTLESLFQRTFDELYGRLQKDGLIAKFEARGLNLYQAITLASIVQKEVGDPSVQPQVAQVFLKRLSEGMVLGSDVTFMYAAKQMGVAPSVDLESPYNTRKYPGLPPGPIANMNYVALQAVADPAPGDYLYFVAGDDGITYFSRTNEEHEALVAAHCDKLCRLE